jgi:hypothetical protein
MRIVSACAIAGAATMTAPSKAVMNAILRTMPSPSSWRPTRRCPTVQRPPPTYYPV